MSSSDNLSLSPKKSSIVIEGIIKAIPVVLVTAFLNGISSYFLMDVGTVRIADSYTVNNTSILTVDIANDTSSQLNGLILKVPAAIDKNNVITSQPIQIKELENVIDQNGAKLLEISGILGQRVTRIVFHLAAPRSTLEVVPLNASSLRLAVEDSSATTSWTKKLLLNLGSSALVYGVLLVIMHYYMRIRINEFEVRLEQAKADTKELNETMSRAQQKQKETTTRLKKVEVFLMARIADLQKELTFWRDTIRKATYNYSTNTDSSKLIDAVTETLGTYSTMGRAQYNFQAVEVLAKALLAHDEQTAEKDAHQPKGSE